ncbi:hypothetical protein [Streptomyces macrosporus]|uniref:Uncharacterized protein n=1 Tax=Streptomyces macrosporus TaxID=44032 RepID=A0ABP5XBT7_9ACTN
MERKEFTPVIRGVNGDGRVTIVIATLNQVDKDNDVTLPGFFGRQTAQVVPSHDWTHVPLGKAVIREEAGRAIADIHFNLKIPAAVDWFEAIKYDFEHPPALQEYSYGFTVLDGGSRTGTFQGRSVRFLTPAKDGRPGVAVHEVSPVLVGAGVGTRTLAVKNDRRQRPNRRPAPAAVRDELRRIKQRLERDELAELKAVSDRMEMAVEALKVRNEAERLVGIGYARVPDVLVPETVKAAARASLARYAPELGISEDITIKYFAEETDEKRAGFWSVWPLNGLCHPKSYPNEIWVRSELSPDEAWRVAAHEIRHMAGGDETEAQIYDQFARMEWLEGIRDAR